jgi:hypothetical protein
LLGNGASIAVHENFDYRNLLTKARTNRLITKQVKTAFEHFKTSDFEYVLNMLWHARHLNMALGVNEIKTAIAYRKVKTALVKTIKHVHPEYSEVLPKLDGLSAFLKHFKTNVSLSYDLVVYWARMFANNQDSTISLKDCFLPTKFDPNWRRLRKPIPPAKRTTLVFYPHGNIALVTDLVGNEHKVIVTTFFNLLNQIESTWNSENYVPVFVSEGSSERKLSAIYRSSYLTTVYEDVLPDVGVSLVAFGWSFGDADAHILDSLSRGRLKRIAVSIFTKNPEWRSVRDNIRTKIKKAFPSRTRPEIVFFDSASVQFGAEVEA